MDDQNKNINQTPDMPISHASVSQPAPVVPPTPQASPTPIATNNNASRPEGKNKGLLLVAVILFILIAVLIGLYYLIIKQANQTASVPPPIVTKPVVQPTIQPTVTPTDNQILNTPVVNPAKDINQLNQNAQGL